MADEKRCVCGHLAEAHEHYRRGSDCALCGAETCGRFRLARRGTPPAASGDTSSAPGSKRDTATPPEYSSH